MRQLGEGGAGEVFLAEHIRLGYMRAVKRVKKTHPAYGQLMKEADILKCLKHSSIPEIYDVEEDEAYSYIIMEYVEGQSLRALCLEQGHIMEHDIVLICLQICEVFQLLHSAEQSILYLDLKPANVIVKMDKIKIIDFGTAKKTNSKEDISKKDISMGTKGFAAPEQYRPAGADRQSDIYGLGNLMLFMATGCKNPAGLHVLEESRDYGDSFKQVIFQCLKYNKAERFETIDQVCKSLLALQTEGDTQESLSDTSTIIAFAGVQHRCGVTHICTLLTEYLCSCGQRAVYVEAGKKRDIHSLVQKEGKGEYPVLCGEPQRLREKYREYRWFLCDYGAYKEAEESFWRQDILCFITGCRPWELGFWEEAEKEVLKRTVCNGREFSGRVYFLANLVSGREFFQLAGKRKITCLKMPYRDRVQKEDTELSVLLGRILKRSIHERDIRCRKRKGKTKEGTSENSLFGRCRTWCRSDTYRYFAGRIFRRKKRGTDTISGGQSS